MFFSEYVYICIGNSKFLGCRWLTRLLSCGSVSTDSCPHPVAGGHCSAPWSSVLPTPSLHFPALCSTVPFSPPLSKSQEVFNTEPFGTSTLGCLFQAANTSAAAPNCPAVPRILSLVCSSPARGKYMNFRDYLEGIFQEFRFQPQQYDHTSLKLSLLPMRKANIDDLNHGSLLAHLNHLDGNQTTLSLWKR